MLTINGIYTDIYESTYEYKVDDIKFYFSSTVYRDKFAARYENFWLEEQKKLEVKFGCNIKCKPLMLMKLYTMIEKRGFRVEINDKTIDSIPLFKIDYVI